MILHIDVRSPPGAWGHGEEGVGQFETFEHASIVVSAAMEIDEQRVTVRSVESGGNPYAIGLQAFVQPGAKSPPEHACASGEEIRAPVRFAEKVQERTLPQAAVVRTSRKASIVSDAGFQLLETKLESRRSARFQIVSDTLEPSCAIGQSPALAGRSARFPRARRSPGTAT